MCSPRSDNLYFGKLSRRVTALLLSPYILDKHKRDMLLHGLVGGMTGILLENLPEEDNTVY